MSKSGMDRRSDCLDPEVLAAYVDRGLSLSERARVESHLASCFQCAALLAGVVRTVEALSDHSTTGAATGTGAIPRLDRHRLVGVLTAAAAVIAVLVVPSMMGPWLDRDMGLVSLVETVGTERSVAGRLTGGFPHAPLGVPSAGGQDGRVAATERLVLIDGKIRESFGERETPSRLHAMGLSQLLLGHYDEAARSLLAASREQPGNAQYLSDLAVVQMERARVGLRPADLPRALAAADRARRIDPSLREAWFNRALAISALSLTDQAKQAWTEYLALDHSSPWAGEARTRLAALSHSTPARAWSGIQARLGGTIDAALADEAVRVQTTEARQYIESVLLPAWAVAVARGDSGSAELEPVRQMADAMQRVAGDALYRDTVAAIDRAESRGPAALTDLARAHAKYANAAALFSDDRYGEASGGLASSRDELTAAGSPLAIRPAEDLAGVALVNGTSQTMLGPLSDALAAAQSHGYTYAAGRASWFQGLIAFNQGRIADARSKYDDALQTFDTMHDTEQAAAVHSLLAALNNYIGSYDESWRQRLLAFEGLAVSRSPRARYTILNSAVPSLRLDSPETALMLEDAALETARAWGRDAAILEGLSQRASVLLSLGRNAEANRDIAEARARLANVPDLAFRRVVELRVLAVEGEALRQSDPAGAVLAASRAIERLQQRGDRLRLAQFNLQLARANIAWGKVDAAELALSQGIRAFDDERASLSDEGRISTLDESWKLFDTAAQLALKKKDYPRAFALAEHARGRTLAEARRIPAGRSLTEVQDTVEQGEAILAVNQFDDELALWLIKRDGTTVTTRSLTRRDAERLVARQQDEIRRETATPDAGAALYNELLKPLAGQLRGVTRLVIVPDSTYEDAAFAGLWDSSRRRYLVEDVVLSLAPSASAFALSVQGPRLTSIPGPPLVLGGPDPASDAGARAVASVYPSAELLTGPAATGANLFADAPGRAIVHVSARTAQNQAYPLLARMTLADEPGRRYSGMVLGRDIAARRFANTSLVVLAESRAANLDENAGTLSVARAFLAAGVPNVLGTLPGVDETASGNLIVGFHRQLASGATAAQALNNIQRNVIQSNGRRLGAWCALVLYGSDR
ncbi:MAG: CHAT domain-containing protein [Vicinamibacterales bacterium]